MPDINLLLEAERRGILPPEKVAALAEARRRGLLKEGEPGPSAQLASLTPQESSPARAPVQTPEREKLQQQLNERLQSADSAGKRLKATEFAVDQVARPLLGGLTIAADATPIVALPRLVANLAARGINKIAGTNIPGIAPITPPSLAPRTRGERFAGGVTGALSGALGGIGLGQSLAATAAPTASRVGQVLAANPGLQAAGATTGAVAGQGVAEAGGGPGAQLIASLVGGLAPSATLQSIGRSATKLGTGATRTPEAQRLLDQGVDLTPGQMNPRGMVNQLEETVQSAPIVGPVVSGARNNARATFQRVAAQEGSAPGTQITQAPQSDMVDQAYQSFAPLYDQAKGFPVRPVILATNGPNVPIDQAINRAVLNRGVRATADERVSVQGFLDDQLTKPLRTSDDLLNIRSSVRAEARSAASSGQSAQAQLLEDADDVLTQALESQLPPGPLNALRTADAKYGDYKTLERAAARSGDRPEGFTPNDLSQAVASANKGANQGTYARGGGGPLRQIAADARSTLDLRAPPTGARLAALPLAAVASPLTLALAGTQTGRRLAQGALPFQAGLRRATAPLQPALADPFAEQLALAIQEATRQAQGAR